MTAQLEANDAPHVVIYDRAHEAHRMHLAGTDWPDIASAFGYASGKSASMAVTAYLQKAGLEHSQEERQDALLLELDRRLDALKAAHWDKAINGDLRAAALVLRLVQQRVRLLGLDRLGAEPAQGSAYSLVIDDR